MKTMDLTDGSISRKLILFSLPMIAGNLLQQFYNLADTLIVGRFIGADALASVGSSYTLMTFLTSLIIGLCMGSSTFFSEDFGSSNKEKLTSDIFLSFGFILIVTVIITALIYPFSNQILYLLKIPDQLYDMTFSYVRIVFAGMFFIFLYNFFSFLLRSLGNSSTPLFFLAFSSILNIILDIYFIASLSFGIAGAALATVISQAISGIGILFLWYGYFRAIEKPSISLLLTIISLGTRVLLSYLLAPSFGITFIWLSIPVGWLLADLTGLLLYRNNKS